MKKQNRHFTFILVLLLLFVWALPCVPALAEAERSGSLSDTVLWELSYDGVLKISGTGEMPDYHYLSHLGEVGSPPWAPFAHEITEIIVGEGITRVGTNAFCLYATGIEYISLQKIVFPSTLQSVGSDAFFVSYFNEDINPTLHVPSLKDWCEIHFETDGTSMDFAVNQFASPVWMTGVPYIDGKQPSGTIVFPKSLTKVESCTFDNWGGITEIVLHDGITEIGELAFAAPALQKINLPDGITEIKMGTFCGCYALEEIDLPDTVKLIGMDAFYACKKLKALHLPQSLCYIGTDAFALCSTLQEIHTSDLRDYLCINQAEPFQGGYLLEGYRDTERTLYLDGEPVTEIVIPYEIKTIPAYAFYGCETLTKVTFETSFDVIGENAFANCTALTAVETIVGHDTIRNASGDIVRDGAFAGCTGLTNIPIVYDYIGASAFKDCVGLTDIELSASHVEPDAFAGCTALKSATLNSALLPDVTNEEHSLSALIEVKLWSAKPTEAFLACYSKIAKDGNYTVYSRCEHKWTVAEDDNPDDCTFDGTCSLCGRTVTDIKEHTAGEWETVKEPTETAEGKKQRTCTVCKKVMETEVLDMLPPREPDEESKEISQDSTEDSTEESEETTSAETVTASSDPAASTEPSESTDTNAPQKTNGVPVWAVVLIALLAAACGVGATVCLTKIKR